MAHFAELDENNIVKRVIVVDNEVIIKNGKEDEELGIKFLQGIFGESTLWKQTSYNGKFRKNFAGKEITYDPVRDAFLFPTCRYPSWILNEDTCVWEPPVKYPVDPTLKDGKRISSNMKRYTWDEPSISWKEI